MKRLANYRRQPRKRIRREWVCIHPAGKNPDKRKIETYCKTTACKHLVMQAKKTKGVKYV